MSRPAAFVLLNPAAGRAADVRRLAFTRREIDARFAAVEVTMDSAGSWKDALSPALARGVRTFIAAGGDGTVHALLAALVETGGAERSARPKSRIFACPSRVTRTFAGLTSRWTSPASCAAARPAAI